MTLHVQGALDKERHMARITGVESITVSSELLPELSAEVHPGKRLTVVVDYGECYRTSIVMDDLLKPLSEALSGLLSAAATLEGWQQLIAFLCESGNAAWKSAVDGKAERLEIRNVHLDYEGGPCALWVLGSADLHGLSAISSGIECMLVRGEAQAVLDETPGLPEWITPAIDTVSEDLISLRGVACAGKQLWGQRHLGLTAFDSSLTLDLERVYHIIAGLFDQEALRWRDILEGWQGLYGDAVLSVHMRTGRYSLALLPSEAAYEAAMPSYAKWMALLDKEEFLVCEPQAVGLYAYA
jgi:hypothetical protein